MPKVIVFLDSDPGGDAPFLIVTRKSGNDALELSRVPCLGEIVNLGADADGIAADYEVVIVRHLLSGAREPEAEVYMRRINMTDVILERRGTPRAGPWKKNSRPALDAWSKPSGTAPTRKRSPR